MRQFSDSMRQFSEIMQQFSDSMRQFSDSMRQFSDSMRQFSDSMRQFSDSMRVTSVSAEKVQKPDIEVKFNKSASGGRNVNIECSSRTFSYKSCMFYRNEGSPHSVQSSSESSVQYVISNANLQHEGFYTCECYTGSKHTETSFRAPVILTNQVEEPEIKMEENENKIVCGSKNNSYKYRLCVLYKNDQQIQDTEQKYRYNKNPTETVTFDLGTDYNHNNNILSVGTTVSVSDLSDGNYFSCMCYTAEPSKWTCRSQSVTKGGNYSNKHDCPSSTGDTGNPTVVVVLVCIIVLLSLLGVIVWRYLSRRNKAKYENTSGAPVMYSKCLAEDPLYATVNDDIPDIVKNNPQKGDTDKTYALLGCKTENKDFVRDDIRDHSLNNPQKGDTDKTYALLGCKTENKDFARDDIRDHSLHNSQQASCFTTYALLGSAAENKDSIKADIHNQFALYSTVNDPE
ncbi:uncharacterized protein LOC122815327 [Protopterus annectens]|uniref:uncharacterized protein LOC122815327 n=1 Tax=Protopterus annectens TaxID=7888 RepID=UPI001CFC1247|nr:uncharacterized protein LOC122815327 [Protopterus annectens]